MEATLEGQDSNVRIRTNKLHDEQLISWADSLADDYIHCPLGENFEMMSFYEMTQQYKKVFKLYEEKVKIGINFLKHTPEMNSVI